MCLHSNSIAASAKGSFVCRASEPSMQQPSMQKKRLFINTEIMLQLTNCSAGQ